MCDHCGCRDLTSVGRLMDEHDRLRELSEHVRRHLTAGDEAAVDQHLPEGHVGRRRLLRVQCFLEIRRRDQTALNHQFSKAGFGLAHW